MCRQFFTYGIAPTDSELLKKENLSLATKVGTASMSTPKKVVGQK